MATYLIQVSGEETTHSTEADKFWQEPIKLNIYINSDWKNPPKSEQRCWKNIKKGDKVLLYCTGSVKQYRKKLSHIFDVEKVEKNNDAKLHLTNKRELSPGMPLSEIRNKKERGELSKEMGNCGTQGFNFCKIRESDIKEVIEWSKKNPPEKPPIEEQWINKYLENNPDVIEEGLTLVDPEKNMPAGAGIPDLLFQDKDGNYLVVEIKNEEASYSAIGQALSYKAALAKDSEEIIRGMIIAKDFDRKIRFIKEMRDENGKPLLEFRKYDINVNIA